MKICMLTNTYLPHVGGVARSVSTFAEEYRKLRHQVLVVAPEFEGPPLPRRAAAIVERVPAIKKFNGSDFSVSLPLAGGLSDRIEAFAADIVHTHHPFLLGDTALRLGAKKNAPVVFTHHTRYEDYTHYMPFDSPTLKSMAIKLSTEFANLCDGVIAPSESIAQLIRRRGVKVPIQVVPTGIDIASLASGVRARFRRKHEIPPGAFVVGHVGRLALEKNLAYLTKAVAEFLRKQPQAYFLVVGAGPAEGTIKELCTKAGVASRLILAGKHTGQSLFDAYAAMDVFAFASRSETQGLVLAEAMAAGLPAVALDASGVREVVSADINGFLLPSRATYQEFAAHLAQLSAQPDTRRRLARGARATARTFARDRTAKAALAFYEEVRRATRRRRLIAGLSGWAAFQQRVKVEWDLLAEKVAAATASPVKRAS